MPRRGKKPGKLAREVFRVGHLEAAGAPAEARLVLIDDLEAAAVSAIEGGARARLGTIREQVARREAWLQDRAAARARRHAAVLDRITTAAAWRGVGIQERYSTVMLRPTARLAVLLLFASLDFFVFAQAYAFVDDVPDFSVQWWLGGLLGLTVFAAGLTLSHQLKTLVVASRQRAYLDGRADEEGTALVPLEVSIPMVVCTAIVFLLLCAAGLAVRVEGGEEQWGALILPASIPLLVVLVEAYVHDPLERRGPSETWVDRLIRGRKARYEHRHDRLLDALQGYLAQVEVGFRYERNTARVIAADLGMAVPARVEAVEATVPAPRNGHVGDPAEVAPR
jgi:hypothetical protein